MLRTPSPSRRVRTPAAPLHGVQSDSWVAFSPRRSGRVAAQRDDNPSQLLAPTGSKPLPNQAAPQSLSPPSSPMSSPYKGPSPRSAHHVHFDSTNLKPDADNISGALFPETLTTRGMLPTPAKTPRKRALKTEESLRSTARILFNNRPSSIEDAMPTPRKNRKSRMDLYSDEPTAEDKIEVYTDSKERIPTADDADDNPFFTRKAKGKAKAKAPTAPKVRKVDPEVAKMQTAVDRGEGMIFLFRGKKVFRKFDDEPAHEPDQPEFPEDEVRKQAGSLARRPFTRSCIAPRILFREEIQERTEKAIQKARAMYEEEEALTDIETPIATPSRKGRKTTGFSTSSRQHELTPPPTIQAQRRKNVSPSPVPDNVGSSNLSFQQWTQLRSAKPVSEALANESTRGKKRAGDDTQTGSSKRARSEHHSSDSFNQF